MDEGMDGKAYQRGLGPEGAVHEQVQRKSNRRIWGSGMKGSIARQHQSWPGAQPKKLGLRMN